MLKDQILKYSRQQNLSPLSPWFDGALDTLIDRQVYVTESQLESMTTQLIHGLWDYRKKYSVDTAVIGMSGGVDSALTAALFNCAGWRVIGVTLPIHQNVEETDRGIEACRALGIEHRHIDLTETFERLLSSVRLYDATIDNTESAIRRGNLRVRSRMITLYNLASMEKGLVASTDNFSELAAGFWTLHGDVGDLAPIQSLNKSWEVPKMAEFLRVPGNTVFATPTDGLGISNGDEDQFGFSYLEFDLVLLSMVADADFRFQGLDVAELDTVNRIISRIKNSSFKRKNPYNLEHPMQTNRFTGLTNIDNLLWANK